MSAKTPIRVLTESEEMYLITIVQMSEQGLPAPIPLGLLAEQLGVLPVSANQMVHKLEGDGWLTYVPYKGVCLTSAGQLAAQRVLHHRRIWEVFLVRHLEMSLQDADALACRLEHLTPDSVAFKLAAFLGNPVASPKGDPIPTLPGESYQGARWQRLLDAPLLGTRQVVEIPPGAAGSFLEETGIRAGVKITVLGKSENGGVLLLAGGDTIHLSRAIASRISVQPDAHLSACESFCAAYSFSHRQASDGS